MLVLLLITEFSYSIGIQKKLMWFQMNLISVIM